MGSLPTVSINEGVTSWTWSWLRSDTSTSRRGHCGFFHRVSRLMGEPHRRRELEKLSPGDRQAQSHGGDGKEKPGKGERQCTVGLLCVARWVTTEHSGPVWRTLNSEPDITLSILPTRFTLGTTVQNFVLLPHDNPLYRQFYLCLNKPTPKLCNSAKRVVNWLNLDFKVTLDLDSIPDPINW